MLLNAGNLRLGWVGFSNFLGEWHTGGRIGPERPSEIDALLHQNEEGGGWRLYLRPQSTNTLLGSNRNSDPASIQLRFREETSNTLQTIALTRGAFSNNLRLYTTATRTPAFTAGVRYVMAFRRAGESSNTVLHLGDHLITIATQDHLDELQIYMEDFAVDIIEDQHTAAVTGIDAGTGIRIDDGDTATPEANVDLTGVPTATTIDALNFFPIHVPGFGLRVASKVTLANSIQGDHLEVTNTGRLAFAGLADVTFGDLGTDTGVAALDDFLVWDEGSNRLETVDKQTLASTMDGAAIVANAQGEFDFSIPSLPELAAGI